MNFSTTRSPSSAPQFDLLYGGHITVSTIEGNSVQSNLCQHSVEESKLTAKNLSDNKFWEERGVLGKDKSKSCFDVKYLRN